MVLTEAVHGLTAIHAFIITCCSLRCAVLCCHPEVDRTSRTKAARAAVLRLVRAAELGVGHALEWENSLLSNAQQGMDCLKAVQVSIRRQPYL